MTLLFLGPCSNNFCAFTFWTQKPSKFLVKSEAIYENALYDHPNFQWLIFYMFFIFVCLVCNLHKLQNRTEHLLPKRFFHKTFEWRQPNCNLSWDLFISAQNIFVIFFIFFYTNWFFLTKHFNKGGGGQTKMIQSADYGCKCKTYIQYIYMIAYILSHRLEIAQLTL